MNPLNELESSLKHAPHVKPALLESILGLTASKEGNQLVIESSLLGAILQQLDLSEESSSTKQICFILVNVSAESDGANAVFQLPKSQKEQIFKNLFSHLFNQKSKIADTACMALCNLTRNPSHASEIVSILEKTNYTFQKLISIASNIMYNVVGCKLHYIGPLLSNLSQCPTVRRTIIDEKLIETLISLIGFDKSPIRKKGIVGTLRNCCFNTDDHEYLLNEIDFLSSILLPLAGGEEFDEEETEKLPVDLQYLPDDKKREPDPDIRKMLLECLIQLCATKYGRNYLRSKNTYLILRELHKWEENREVLLACENVVDILIRTEEELNAENLKEIEVPTDLVSKFEKMDKDFLNPSN